MFYLRLLAAGAAFAAVTLWGLVVALFRRDRAGVAYAYARWVARWVAPPLGLRARVMGEERLSAYRPCIFVCNHQSLLDVPALARCFKPGSVIIAKKEVASVPLFGWLYDATGQIRIDRKNSQQAVGRLREAEEAIRARGVGVWIFPEGTRGKEPGVMLPFKKGAFVMAVNTGAPLVPVVVSPLKPKSDIHARRLEPQEVEVRVLEPIPAGGLGDADLPALMAEARRRMYAALAEMSGDRGIAPPPEALEALAAAQRSGGGRSSTMIGGRSPGEGGGGGGGA
ncbi:MAG TPA: lysophospholipid acyltransferase family protein [Longimicrobium sp.]|jgi:1-acyl-sn-glycerol-3-phosphate acyltransferase